MKNPIRIYAVSTEIRTDGDRSVYSGDVWTTYHIAAESANAAIAAAERLLSVLIASED
jgi:hypothetical protein